MRRTSLILKYLMIVVVSLVGALLVLIALAAYSVYVQEIPYLTTGPLKNALYSFQFFFDYTPWTMWLLIGLAVFLVIFLALSIPIILRIRRASKALTRIAQGDYDVRLRPRGRDELRQLETDINAMARQISRAFELQKAAERSKDEFVINIAHDLRTPLTSVLGYLSLLSESEPSPEDAARYIRIAHSKATQLSKLVNDLFDLLRLTPDMTAIDAAPISAKALLMQVADESFALVSDAGMRIRLINVPDDLTFTADGALLSRVYDNLILNAVRYARDGRFIDLSARPVKNGVRLSVTTHSNPIPEDQLGAIFDRLHRGDASRSLKTGGAGLGLAICKGIVELHGGAIRAVRTDDGTRFEFHLPQSD